MNAPFDLYKPAILAGIACAGGCVVFWGLWKEHKSDKPWFNNIADARTSEKRSKIGWRILMGGIALEIITACSLTWYEVKAGIETERALPINQPVSDISAKVVIALEGTNVVMDNPAFARADTRIDLHEKDMSNWASGTTLGTLMTSEVMPFSHREYPSLNVTYQGYVIMFIENPLMSETRKPLPVPETPTAKDAMEKIKVLRIWTSFIPRDAKILGGNATVTINGTFKARFVISPDGADKFILNLNPDLKSLVFLATNSIP